MYDVCIMRICITKNKNDEKNFTHWIISSYKYKILWTEFLFSVKELFINLFHKKMQ